MGEHSSTASWRLAGDHGSLHTAGLPPNYLFPPNTDGLADLTSLDVLLCGPVGTPYAEGVWRLHLDIPPTYPTAAPAAFFRTRCWHPNVDETTGAICVETLKRDWTSTLKLRDVLVTISCLLIQPNPASALNEEAGKLANEDWAGFCRRAKLMTEIHAAVPRALAQDVKEAQMRGEEKQAGPAGKEPKLEVRGKGKECVKLTPPTSSKAQRMPLVEDEENARNQARTERSESDESDWIPGPTRSPRRAFDSKLERNIPGTRGLDPSTSLEDAPKRVLPTDSRTGGIAASELENIHPATIVTSGRTAYPQTPSTLPMSSKVATSQHAATSTPELLKCSDENPFSVIRPNGQPHPLLVELSYTWRDAAILHDAGWIEDSESQDVVRKRSAGAAFEKKKEWELKHFKRAGCNLQKYNRGDVGPRTGIGRL